MKRYTLAVLMRNQIGVLNRLTNVFRRRQFNINSIAVNETDTDELSRITITFEGEPNTKDHLISQLLKLPDIYYIRELVPQNCVTVELTIVKLQCDEQRRPELLAVMEDFGATFADEADGVTVVQLTADCSTIEVFLRRMQPFRVLELCRTGPVCLEKGTMTLRPQK